MPYRITCRYRPLLTQAEARSRTLGVVEPILAQGAQAISQEWARSVPHRWPYGTGRTAQSLTITHPSRTRFTIGSAYGPIRWLEEGARQHLIRPRRATRLLRWPPDRGGAGEPGVWRIRAVARHPGISRRDLGRKALVRVNRNLETMLGLALRRMFS